jgi:hypothetical protein
MEWTGKRQTAEPPLSVERSWGVRRFTPEPTRSPETNFENIRTPLNVQQGELMFTPRSSIQQELLRAPEGAILPGLRGYHGSKPLSAEFTPIKLREAAAHSLKTVIDLFEHPLITLAMVVAETQVMIQAQEAVGLAGLLHFLQLWNFEFMVPNCTPIVASPVHGKTRGQTATCCGGGASCDPRCP